MSQSKEAAMKTPFFVLTQEVAAVDLAARHASDELNRSRSARRQRRAARRAENPADRRR
jgi:hypothetical protein